MQYDEVLDLAIDLLCCMQFQTAREVCAEISPQLDDDPWSDLLAELAKLLPDGGDPSGVYRAEQRLSAGAASVLGEATHHAPLLRRFRHAAASTMRRVQGRARVVQPTVLHRPGAVTFREGCQLGYLRSPGSSSGVGYIDCTHPDAVISIGARTVLNNDFAITSESSEGIRIGADCLVGAGCGSSTPTRTASRRTSGTGHTGRKRRSSSRTTSGSETVWLCSRGDHRAGLGGRGAGGRKRVSTTGTVVAGIPARVVGTVHG